jgi:hypothetical protein
MRPRLHEPAFRCGQTDYTWADALLASRLWGAWDGLEQVARNQPAANAPVPDGALDEATREFRYARRLLSADELRAWLERWGIEHAELTTWLRSRAGPVGEAGPLTAEALWLEAVCSGALEAFAEALAGRAAARAWSTEASEASAGVHRRPLGIDAGAVVPGPEASAALGLDPPSAAARLAQLSEAEEAFVAFCAAALDERAIQREVASHAVDWLLLDCEHVLLPNQDAAREIALLVREDGAALAEVAALAGVSAGRARLLPEQLEPELAAALVSAAPGSLVGPLEAQEGRFALFLVRDKVTPSASDPAIRERAEEAVRQRAVEREVDNRVRWHDRP